MRNLTYILLLMMVFTIPIEGVTKIAGAFSITRLVGLLALASWLTSVIIAGKFRRLHVIHLLVAAYILWFGVTSVWSANPVVTVSQLTTYVQVGVFFFLIWDILTTQIGIEHVLQAFVFGAAIAATGVLRNLLTSQAYNVHNERYTSFGDVDPNSIGVIMVLAIVMAWRLAQSSELSERHAWLRVVNYLYIPAATFAVLLTASRTALIAIALSYLFILIDMQGLAWASKLVILVLFAGALVLVVRYVPAASIERLATVDESVSAGDLTGRGEIWQKGAAWIASEPLFGVGGGNFSYVVGNGFSAHNFIISIWSETGIVGLFLFGAIICCVLWCALQHEPREALFWLTLIGIWMIGASSLNWEQRKQTWLLFGLVVSSAYALRIGLPGRVPSEKPTIPSYMLTGAR